MHIYGLLEVEYSGYRLEFRKTETMHMENQPLCFFSPGTYHSARYKKKQKTQHRSLHNSSVKEVL